MVDVVKYNLPLKALKLGWCKIGKRAGAEHAAQLLQFNESLEVPRCPPALFSLCFTDCPSRKCIPVLPRPASSIGHFGLGSCLCVRCVGASADLQKG